MMFLDIWKSNSKGLFSNDYTFRTINREKLIKDKNLFFIIDPHFKKTEQNSEKFDIEASKLQPVNL